MDVGCYYALMRLLAHVPVLNELPGLCNYTTRALNEQMEALAKKNYSLLKQNKKDIREMQLSNIARFDKMKQLVKKYPKGEWQRSPDASLISTYQMEYEATEERVKELTEDHKERLKEFFIRDSDEKERISADLYFEEDVLHKRVGTSQSKKLNKYRQEKMNRSQEKERRDTDKMKADIKGVTAKALSNARKEELLQEKQVLEEAFESTSTSRVNDMLLKAIAEEEGGGGGERGEGEGEGGERVVVTGEERMLAETLQLD